MDMDITEDLRELRDDLFGIGLEDSASREVRIFFKSRKTNETEITFEFLSPTAESSIVKSFLEILLKVKESDFKQLPIETQEWSGPDLLKKCGVYVESGRFAPHIFSLANSVSIDQNDVFDFKRLTEIIETSLPFWEIEGFDVGVIQKNELQILHTFKLKQVNLGSSGVAGISGSVGVSGTAPIIRGTSGTGNSTHEEIITYTSQIEEEIPINYGEYIKKNFF